MGNNIVVQEGRTVSVGATTNIFNPIKPLLFLGATALGIVIGGGFVPAAIPMAIAGVVVGILLASAVGIAAQWEKALIFRLGKFRSVCGPGPFLIIPLFESAKIVDTRIQTLEIPHRQAITKDNVPVRIDGVIFMRVEDPSAAVIKVQNYHEAVLEYSQTALRDVVGSSTLDEILADREALGQKIQHMVETEIDGWGLEVAAIRIQDIEMPEDLKRVMARQASAEREKRATITKAEGDRDAAANLAAAAEMMYKSPGALQLRTLQTLDGLGSSSANTVVLALPTEVFEAIKSVPGIASALESKPTE